MRYLLLLVIVLVSLCAGLPEIPFINPGNATKIQQAGMITIDTESPDIFISAEIVPSEIKSGRDATIFFELRNKNTFDLKNISLEVYDSCVFSGEFKKEIDELKSNRSARWSWKWSSEKVDLDRGCNIKFRTTYDADYSIFQDVAVLTSSEYQAREVAGILPAIPIQSSSTVSPFKISLSFSESQPFVENENYRMYMDYFNQGAGVIDFKALTIAFPDNLKNFTCNDYRRLTESEVCSLAYDTKPGDLRWNSYCDSNNDDIINLIDITSWSILDELSNILNITRKLNFINNRASGSTCNFTTVASQEMDIKSLTITASYKYILDNSISIRVKRV
jgi:hypothetical protein